MNERMLQLYKMAHVSDTATDPSNNMPYETTCFSAEKFAKLIVRECINKIETYRIPVGNSAAGEMACEWTYDALKEIRAEIKEHFGVE